MPAMTDEKRRALNTVVANILLQFVVLIISLGFANAFQLFAPQAAFDRSILAFAIYVLVGLRFLAANLLYLAYEYPQPSNEPAPPNAPAQPPPKKIYADACGMIVTGIVIGLAGSYVTEPPVPDHCAMPPCDAPYSASLRFYLCLLVILAADFGGSLWSHWVNRDKSKKFWPSLKSCDVRWILNNLIFGAIIAALLYFLWHDRDLPDLLTLAIALISTIALGITFDGFWRFGALVVLALVLFDAWLFLYHRDATSWLMLVTVTNSVISFLLTYEGCLLAEGED
jgi:hypothetical protein